MLKYYNRAAYDLIRQIGIYNYETQLNTHRCPASAASEYMPRDHSHQLRIRTVSSIFDTPYPLLRYKDF